ncbi:MAG: hypothetical protein EXR89_06900 [Methylococcaceae bacterium]|nr:hypothetical protein [Methylococcaceae bacterium]
MAKLTFIELAQRVLTEHKTPLSVGEMWNYVVEKKYHDELDSKGKTPQTSMGAQMGQAKKIFAYTDDCPRRYYLREIVSVPEEKFFSKSAKTYLEKDLHPLLVYFAKTYLNVFCKTINHSKSGKKEFGEWLHPDIVGCWFPIGNWSQSSIELSQALGVMNVWLYSFELKHELNFSNLREAFFQAVSNSSWAREGYLCAADISKDDDFSSELKRLSGSFGIGVIELNVSDPSASRVIFPAKQKENLDWESIDKLCNQNPDFKDFLKSIKDNLKISKIHKDEYDDVLSAEELQEKFQP